MPNYELCQLSVSDGRDIYDMLQRIERHENDFNNEAKGMTYEQFKSWLCEREAWSRGELLPSGYVKQWIYWLKVDGIPVGIGKIRESVTEESAKWGGNIGLAIDSLHRSKGFGTILFGFLLDKAKELGINKVYSTVLETNIGSRRVHEKCGGDLVEKRDGTCYFVFDFN